MRVYTALRNKSHSKFCGLFLAPSQVVEKQVAPGRSGNGLLLSEGSYRSYFVLCLYSLKLEKLLLSFCLWSLGVGDLPQLLLLCMAEVCRASEMPVAWIQGSPASESPRQPCVREGLQGERWGN